MKPLHIGTVTLKSPLVSAPLAGISDIAFRILCRKHGASLSTTEMVNVNAIFRDNIVTKQMMTIDGFERPIAIQLFGNDLEIIKKAAKIVETTFQPDIIDFNFGCPASDVMRQGSGSALLNKPQKIFEIIKILKETVTIPVTAKIRLGITEGKPLYKEVVTAVEKAKADAIIVHGRFAKQGYSGTANWDEIKKIKEMSSIPIIGNGDITNHKQAINYIKQGFCDGVMIGRGAIGNTKIFSNKNNEYTFQEKIEEFIEYCNLAKQYGVFIFAKAKIHAQHYTKGFENAAKLRHDMNKTSTLEELITCLNKYK